MKQMSLIEMDGFLKGKCIPSDLKVNETNAEYLVRKFAEAEAKISALSEDHQKAIESIKQADSAVKLAHEKFSALAAENELARKAVQAFCDVVGDNTEVIAEEVGRDGVLVILGAMKATGNIPATDAFLAEVRAQGVEMYADNLDNAADDAERGGFDYAVKFLRSEASGVRLFADQLRKGGNQ
ncbi:ead/Ea22-like family protein [Escherichia coli]|nr:ead/Ea22-like family protein [Salmonella enterica subsp. enterica serovar Alachua]ECB6472468.1 ead/Ea22-like family protein [Salmonella enterica subsp. enterica serovar Alachua]